MDKKQIAAEIYAHQQAIGILEQSLDDFDSLIENNQYSDHKNAEYSITGRFSYIASEQCEGSHNYGEEMFKQQYQIAGNSNTFEASVQFEYSRHDKTYYYIDETNYSYVQVSTETQGVAT